MYRYETQHHWCGMEQYIIHTFSTSQEDDELIDALKTNSDSIFSCNSCRESFIRAYAQLSAISKFQVLTNEIVLSITSNVLDLPNVNSDILTNFFKALCSLPFSALLNDEEIKEKLTNKIFAMICQRMILQFDDKSIQLLLACPIHLLRFYISLCTEIDPIYLLSDSFAYEWLSLIESGNPEASEMVWSLLLTLTNHEGFRITDSILVKFHTFIERQLKVNRDVFPNGFLTFILRLKMNYYDLYHKIFETDQLANSLVIGCLSMCFNNILIPTMLVIEQLLESDLVKYSFIFDLLSKSFVSYKQGVLNVTFILYARETLLEISSLLNKDHSSAPTELNTKLHVEFRNYVNMHNFPFNPDYVEEIWDKIKQIYNHYLALHTKKYDNTDFWLELSNYMSNIELYPLSNLYYDTIINWILEPICYKELLFDSSTKVTKSLYINLFDGVIISLFSQKKCTKSLLYTILLFHSLFYTESHSIHVWLPEINPYPSEWVIEQITCVLLSSIQYDTSYSYDISKSAISFSVKLGNVLVKTDECSSAVTTWILAVRDCLILYSVQHKNDILQPCLISLKAWKRFTSMEDLKTLYDSLQEYIKVYQSSFSVSELKDLQTFITSIKPPNCKFKKVKPITVAKIDTKLMLFNPFYSYNDSVISFDGLDEEHEHLDISNCSPRIQNIKLSAIFSCKECFDIYANSPDIFKQNTLPALSYSFTAALGSKNCEVISLCLDNLYTFSLEFLLHPHIHAMIDVGVQTLIESNYIYRPQNPLSFLHNFIYYQTLRSYTRLTTSVTAIELCDTTYLINSLKQIHPYNKLFPFSIIINVLTSYISSNRTIIKDSFAKFIIEFVTVVFEGKPDSSMLPEIGYLYSLGVKSNWYNTPSLISDSFNDLLTKSAMSFLSQPFLSADTSSIHVASNISYIGLLCQKMTIHQILSNILQNEVLPSQIVLIYLVSFVTLIVQKLVIVKNERNEKIEESDDTIEEILHYNLNNLHPRNDNLKTIQWYVRKLWNDIVEFNNLFVNFKQLEGSANAFYSSIAILISHFLVLTFPHVNKEVISILYGIDTINNVVNDILGTDVREDRQNTIFYLSCSKDIINERPYENYFYFLITGLFFHCVKSNDENNPMWKVLFEGPYPLTVLLNSISSTFEYLPFINHRYNDNGLSLLRFIIRVMENVDKSKCNVNDSSDFSGWIHFLTDSIKYPNITCIEQWIRCFVRLFIWVNFYTPDQIISFVDIYNIYYNIYTERYEYQLPSISASQFLPNLKRKLASISKQPKGYLPT